MRAVEGARKEAAPALGGSGNSVNQPEHVEVRCSAAGSVGRLRTTMYEYVTPRTKTIHIELTGGSQPGYAELRQLREASLGLRCRGVVVTVESNDRTARRMLELAGLTPSARLSTREPV
jgi:hypothetical protein